jgi:UDP-GlcNAc:undecaprenyl-phosphate GlcNAc-1-phosphate transferase
MIIFGVYLARVRVYDDAISRAEGRTFTPVVANFMYKRRVAEVLLDLCLIPLAYYTAYRLRFEAPLFAPNYPLVPAVAAGRARRAVDRAVRRRRLSRHVALLRDDGRGGVRKGGRARARSRALAMLYLYRFESYSRSVFVIDAVC